MAESSDFDMWTMSILSEAMGGPDWRYTMVYTAVFVVFDKIPRYTAVQKLLHYPVTRNCN